MATAAVLRRNLARPRLWRTILRAAACASGIAGALVFVVAPLTGHFSGAFEDFRVYLGAAQAAAAHGDIYAAFIQQHQNVALSGFDYPPAVALMLTPLAWMPPQAAATVWLLIDVAATLAGCVVVARTVLPATWPRTELAVLAAFVYAAATYNLWHGQMNPIIFLLLAGALRSWVRGEQTACGVLLGVAAAIKLAPLVLLLLLFRRRWWQGLAAGLGAFLLLAGVGVLGFGIHISVEYVQSVLPVLSGDNGWMYNQSWDGVVNRLADHSVLAFQPGVLAIRVLVLSLSAASVLAAAWVVRVQRAGDDVRAAQFGAGVVAMLLAGTVTWYPQGIHLLIPFAAGAVLAARRAHGWRAITFALGACVLAEAVVAPLLIGAGPMDVIIAVQRTAWWRPLLVLTALPALSSAALLFTMLRALSAARTAGRVSAR